eukprot:m.306553 g.306553  ORF g.306553 m.306553 type:complete len:673 (+) comp41345_c0_seq1:144-2162(+)
MSAEAMKWPALLLLVFGNLLVTWLTTTSALQLEAEDGSYLGNRKHRGAASNAATVLLHQGGVITLSFRVYSLCNVTVQNVAYTNDGGSDTVIVTLGGKAVGSFQTIAGSNLGQNWNVIRNSGSIGSLDSIRSGSHTLLVTATSTDLYGVEIDAVSITFNQGCLTHIKCINPTTIPVSQTCSKHGSIVQKSEDTTCAEEDNIHVPIYYNGISEFTITAALPKYSSLTMANNREADFTTCELTNKTIWQFGINDRRSAEFSSSCSNQPSTFKVSSPLGNFCRELNFNNFRERVLVFNAKGLSSGVVEASIGSVLTVQFAQVTGTLVVEAAAYGRKGTWSSLGRRTFTSASQSHTWPVPDLTWKEGSNMIRLTATQGSSSSSIAFFDYVKLEERDEKGELDLGELYNDGVTIVRAINIDFWWLYPQSMVVRNTVTGKSLTNVTYIRISRKMPSVNSWPEVFILYQDGNSRILTFPPSGVDWIPFGSSVIIGQSDPDATRPYSAISQVDFDPSTTRLTVYYAAGGQAVITIGTSTLSTIVTVNKITYTKNSSLPFATFRSMWVRDGNADVDHVSSGNQVRHIVHDRWKELNGTNFVFFRTCVSQHNTLSPDIRIEVQCAATDTATATIPIADVSTGPASLVSTATATSASMPLAITQSLGGAYFLLLLSFATFLFL